VDKPGLATLFLSFLRLGVTAFGGPAMVVYIRELSVKRNQWLDEKTFNDGVALCQSIPGATAIQTAAYVGLRTRGVMGALLSYVGFGLPAFLFMLTLSSLYLRYHELPAVAALFAVLQVIVVALIANATFLLGKGLIRQPVNIAIALASAVLFGLTVSPFLVILGGGAVGALLLRRKGPHIDPGSTGGVLFHGKPVLLFLALIAAGLTAAYAVNPKLFHVALTMLKVDCFAFGGGFAALPLMLHEVVNVKGWLTGPAFMDGIALGQVTPGPIIITATFVGFLTAGLAGAVVATCAIFSPSFVVLLIAAPLFERLKSSPVFTGATRGVFATFLGLLIFMTVKFGLLVPWDAVRVGVGFLAFGALLRKVDTFYIVLGGAVLSFVLFR
jgi:chromate transporter